MQKLNQCKSGNISHRWKDGFLITPSGMYYDKIKPDDIVYIKNGWIDWHDWLNIKRKRNIKVMREEYLTMFIMDMKDTLKYTKSSQYQSPNLKIAT